MSDIANSMEEELVGNKIEAEDAENSTKENPEVKKEEKKTTETKEEQKEENASVKP